MNFTDLPALPPGVMTLFIVMLWPAIWAAALMTAALAGDVMRQTANTSRVAESVLTAGKELR